MAALESGYGWSGLAVFVVCVQSYKKDSPSSGLFRVKVCNTFAYASGAGEHGMAQRNGTGMFPREVMKSFPLLPVEEEAWLNDMPLRENFVERVFAYGGKLGFPLGSLPAADCTTAWTQMLENEPTPGGLVPGKSTQGRQAPNRPQADVDGSPWQ